MISFKFFTRTCWKVVFLIKLMWVLPWIKNINSIHYKLASQDFYLPSISRCFSLHLLPTHLNSLMVSILERNPSTALPSCTLPYFFILFFAGANSIAICKTWEGLWDGIYLSIFGSSVARMTAHLFRVSVTTHGAGEAKVTICGQVARPFRYRVSGFCSKDIRASTIFT